MVRSEAVRAERSSAMKSPMRSDGSGCSRARSASPPGTGYFARKFRMLSRSAWVKRSLTETAPVSSWAMREKSSRRTRRAGVRDEAAPKPSAPSMHAQRIRVKAVFPKPLGRRKSIRLVPLSRIDESARSHAAPAARPDAALEIDPVKRLRASSAENAVGVLMGTSLLSTERFPFQSFVEAKTSLGARESIPIKFRTECGPRHPPKDASIGKPS